MTCVRVGHDCDGRGCGCTPAAADCECLVCADWREEFDPDYPIPRQFRDD